MAILYKLSIGLESQLPYKLFLIIIIETILRKLKSSCPLILLNKFSINPYFVLHHIAQYHSYHPVFADCHCKHLY